MLERMPGQRDEFAGMAAVVTGAAQGIGSAIAGELHAQGARLLLVDCNAAGVAATAESLRKAGRAAVDFAVADLADPNAIELLATQIAVLESRIDVLVNNAGIESDLPFAQVTAAVFDRVIAVNLRAPLLVSQALAPLFPAAGGAIVNVSSIHASHAFPNAIPYASSKAGLLALTRNLALELAPRKIRVNAVCPGYIDTPMWDEWLHAAPDPEALASRTAALHPLGRRGVPADVASVVAYLASPRSAWITGTHLVVDGGLTIRAHP
ncbi:MAG TPA: SDR family NAD(P)-dependent oxidoreductase [Terracidiphilus sp.]|jgi:NAD(P)-dependent dehydrogenase (short-subunit alcohol dehydrogenase family)